MNAMPDSAAPTVIDDAALRAWPLPPLDDSADKEARGRVVIVAGSREIAGAAVLAATAALRAGAGKLAIGTAASVAPALAVAVPEARVIALPETGDGGLRADGARLLARSLAGAGALLVGPGLMDAAATRAFVAALLPLARGVSVVLDAAAMDVVRQLARFDGPVLLTPHAGEMAHLTGLDKDRVQADPEGVARAAAQRWNALVALKGPTTWLAGPEGVHWRHAGGNAGLATSGSGDTLAGAIAGLAARGAPLAQACAWGVALHARAGERLARQVGPVGYLAREIAGEMATVLREMQQA